MHEGLAADQARTRELDERGIRVLRFSDREILLQGEVVLEAILAALGSYRSSAGPSP